jgi:pyruvate/2-oxoglutarate dehydrogenase complex dihydrolipoamide acyltransferase (E2) component
MPRDPSNKIVRLEPWRKIVSEGFDIARKADAYGVMLQDMSAAEEFIREYRQQQHIPLTYLHLMVKACALMIRKCPPVNHMLQGRKIIIPSSIDVGVTLSSQDNVSPVAVIQAADVKSLKEITAELREKGRQARQQQREHQARLNRIGHYVPLPFLRRQIISWVLKSSRLRRENVGTVQISALGSAEIDFFSLGFLATSLLVGVSEVRRRAIVVGDQVEARPTVYLSFQVDHRVLGGKEFRTIPREINYFLLHPEELDA